MIIKHYCKHFYLPILLYTLIAQPLMGQDFVLRSCGVFSPQPPGVSMVDEGPTILTGENRVIVYAEPNEPVKFSMDIGNRWMRGGYATTFFLTDKAGTILDKGQVVDGTAKTFAFPVRSKGVYYLQIIPGDSTCALKTISSGASYEASAAFPLSAYPKNGWWYFYVPTGKNSFTLHLSSPVQDKTRVTVGDANGRTILTTQSLRSEVLDINVPPGMGGTVWRFKAEGPSGWQSITFWLDGACPYVSDTAQGLVIPLIDYGFAPAGDQTEVTLNFNLTNKDLPQAADVNVRVENEAVAIQHQNAYTNLPGKVVFKVADSKIPAAYRVFVNFESGKKVITCQDTIWITHHALFRKIRYENILPLPQVSDEDRARGFLVFSRTEPGSICLDSVPRSEELIRKVEVSATPGQYAAFYFAIHALNDLKEVTYRAAANGDMASADPDCFFSREGDDLRVVRYWPQRVSAYSNRFYIAPELLDRLHPVSIGKGQNGLFYGRLKIPDSAKPGVYRGTIEVLLGGKCAATLEMTVTVLPFHLRTPDNIRWILDIGIDVTRDQSGRGVVHDRENPWHKESAQEIRARYQVIRDSGINSLSLPLYVEFENVKGTLRPKPDFFSSFNERMKIIKELGFKGPIVLRTFWDYLTLEADPNPLTEDKLAYTAPAHDIYRQHLALVAGQAKEHQWPDYIYYEVDEPDDAAKRAHFIRTAKIIKEMGCKVFSTIADYYADEIDGYIDYRCINGIGYTCLESPEHVRQIKQRAAASGDVFWFYGGGSYTYLEGIICGNRYLNGLFLWRTGATGILNWIACWPMPNMKVDDFDDVQKDYCIYYPSCHPKDPLTPTLQWEGIREGIDDYKYLYTLMDMSRELMMSKDPEVVMKAQKIRADIEARLDKVPWRHTLGAAYPPQDITNGDLSQIRQEIIRSILILNTMRKGN